ncbi:hypothetical protein [Chitinolyticbacter meiyuanensis]|uniref:hypothetical protein n=1 Tax=Chitinolyticbacter meiyuanensis TaxID=682798 RepID=UPI0011E59E25|nr:hypothetical protein [Chitinolyticbacter meiyuanensis]
MTRRNLALACTISAGLLYPAAHAEDPGLFERSAGKAQRINCARDPQALKAALERRSGDAEKLRFVVAGECQGPLRITQGSVDIVGDAGQPGAIRITQPGEQEAAILVRAASARLANLNILVPVGAAAIKAKANATVEIDRVTTNAQSDWGAPRGQFVVTDSSSVFFTNQVAAEVLVVGGSSAEFEAGNSQTVLDIRDTSAVKSSGNGNHFKSAVLSANGYFLADNQARIDALAIWGKASAEVTRASRVGTIDMGGQTLFAAYLNSSVTGPYGIYGNVVFELEHSTATGWKTVNNPHAMFIGNEANVNGTVYPGWSWSGQDGSQPQQ